MPEIASHRIPTQLATAPRHRIAVGELVDRSGAGDCANQMQDPEVLATR